LEQNTDSWLEWRKKGIGGSDAPIIMGLSPWKTAYELWEEKTGLVVRDEDNSFITQKGHRLEPRARALYEIETGIAIPPKLVERIDKPEHRASLDGLSEDGKKAGEIKFVGSGEKWEMALNGEIPDYYYCQMMWQLYVSGAETNDYIPYNEEENKILIITKEPDLKYIKNMVKEVEKFWSLVINKKEPKLSDRDYKKVSSKDMKNALDEYARIKKEITSLTADLDVQKKIILEHPRLNHRRMEHKNIKIITKDKKGGIDYKKIMADHLPNLDVEKYRKTGTTYKEIKVGK